MDTPCQPSRRKLKRVLKKVDKFNSSAKKLSQKKLRAAINTSLNSTNSLRSLKNNNYSLALRLENVKEELKVIKDEKNDLLEENFALREKVNSLEQLLVEGVQQRENRVEMDIMKGIIKSLNSHVTNFCVDLEQLAQICFSRTSSLESQRTSDTKRKSASGDSGDCGFQPENSGESPSQASMSVAEQNTSTTIENSPVKLFEQQYASSVNKMRCIEKRVQMENELPRRIRRSIYCPEEDEDIGVIQTELGNDITVVSGITDVEPPTALVLSDQLDDHKLEVSSKKKSTSKSKKHKKVSKQPLNFGIGQDLHIANEFALNAAHLNITEKNKIDNVAQNETEDTVCGDVEHTIHMTTDMELTMPIDTTVVNATQNQEYLEKFRETLSSAKPRWPSQVLVESSDDQTSQSSNELVPDAITMRKMKPGQFKFAVGRKDSEGCRKDIVDVPRARSKSKKRIAEMIEQLPHEEPKSIFDFHEKTPKFFSDDNDEALSVYNLDNEPASSPCRPLKKDMVLRRATYSIGGLKEFDANRVETSSEYSLPLKDIPSNMTRRVSHLSRSRSRRRTKNSTRSSIVDDHLLSNDETLKQGCDKDLTLIRGETYSEPLKDSPSNMPRDFSQSFRSRSRRRTKNSTCSSAVDDHLLSNDETLEQGYDKDLILIRGETYSEPLKDSPSNMPRDYSLSSRSRSRRRTKTTTRSSIVDDLLLSNDETLEQAIDNGFTLIRGEAYSEPLKDSPSNMPRDFSQSSRSRSRRRTRNTTRSSIVSDLLSNNEVLEQDENNGLTLIEGQTYSEPLKGSPHNVATKTVVSRSRSRRRTKPLVDADRINEGKKDIHNLDSDASSSESLTTLGKEDSIALSHCGGEIYSEQLEPLKGSPQDIPKKTSRSRSKRRTKVLSITSDLVADIVSQDEKDGCNLIKGTTNVETSEPSSDEIPKKLSKISRCRSQRRTKKVDELIENAGQDSNAKSSKQKDSLDNAEEMAFAETLHDSSNKSANNKPKTSKSHTHKGIDAMPISPGLNSDDVFNCEIDNENQDKGKMPSVLGEGITYSEPLKDSPVKTPKVSKRSKSQTRLTRSTGRSLKSNKCGVVDNVLKSVSRKKKSRREMESDGVGLEESDRLNEQILESLDNSNKVRHSKRNLQVLDSLTVDQNTNFEEVSNLSESNDCNRPIITQEICSINTDRGKEGSLSTKAKVVEAYNTISKHKTQHISSPDDNFRDNSKFSGKKGSYTTDGKRNRSRNVENLEMQVNEECDDTIIYSYLESDFIPFDKNKGKENNSSTTNSLKGDEIELNLRDRSDIFFHVDAVDGFESSPVKSRIPPIEGKDKLHVAEKSVDNDDKNCPLSNSPVPSLKKSKKRKQCRDVGSSKTSNPVKSKQPAKTSKEDRELTHSVSSESLVQLLDEKDTSSCSLESLKQTSPLRDNEKQTILHKSSPLPQTPPLKEEIGGFQPERQRRTKQIMSYAEPSINKKLRRGDPFTAALGRVKIYKSPKLQGKKKSNRNVLESLQNLTDSTIME